MTEELPEIPGFRYARPLGRNVHQYRAADGEAQSEGGSVGEVVVTVTRVNPRTLRFSWTYPSPQPGDKFVRRTNDELKTGTVSEPRSS